MAKPFLSLLLRGYTKATIMPMHHRRARPAHVAKSWPLTPLQVVHNKPDVMLRVKHSQSEIAIIATDKIQEKRIERVQNIKEHVSVH